MSSFNRRSVLMGAAALAGATTLRAKAVLAEAPLASTLIRRVVQGPANTYFTYPHSHGFLPDGRAVLASPGDVGGRPGVVYLAFDPAGGDAEQVASVSGARMYYAISKGGLMVVPRKFGAVAVDLTREGARPRELFNEDGWTVAGDCEISPDGSRALFTRSHYEAPRADTLDVFDMARGELTRLLAPGWQMDHAHFSPHDPNWICYCNNDAKQFRRMWVHHPEEAPEGRHIFEQKRADGKIFVVSHERAMFHKNAMITIAHGSSSATPRGLYEVGFDGSTRLLSESNQDFHCNISRDGRWAVVSLQSTRQPDGRRAPGDWLRSPLGYGESDVELVNLRNGKRRFLFRGSNARDGQPYEVQPTISPDGRWVVLKDARTRSVLFLEIDPSALRLFLSA